MVGRTGQEPVTAQEAQEQVAAENGDGAMLDGRGDSDWTAKQCSATCARGRGAGCRRRAPPAAFVTALVHSSSLRMLSSPGSTCGHRSAATPQR